MPLSEDEKGVIVQKFWNIYHSKGFVSCGISTLGTMLPNCKHEERDTHCIIVHLLQDCEYVLPDTYDGLRVLIERVDRHPTPL